VGLSGIQFAVVVGVNDGRPDELLCGVREHVRRPVPSLAGDATGYFSCLSDPVDGIRPILEGRIGADRYITGLESVSYGHELPVKT